MIVLPAWSRTAVRRLLHAASCPLGCDVHGWRGRNVWPSETDVPAIIKQISRLRAATPLPVSLVGWSRRRYGFEKPPARYPHSGLRGDYTREPVCSARRKPSRQHLAHAHGRKNASLTRWRIELLARPIPVPVTSIYSRSDGVVAWRACLGHCRPVGPAVW